MKNKELTIIHQLFYLLFLINSNSNNQDSLKQPYQHRYILITIITIIIILDDFTQQYSLNIYLVRLKSMAALTSNQQTGRTAYLGIAFMIMFTAFNSLQNIVSKIYEDYGYHNLGTTSLIVVYGVFGCFTFFAPFVIRSFGFKKSMFISCIGYALYEAAGLIIAFWESAPKGLGWFFVLLGAVFCGASASVIWVAQGSYISQISDEESKTKLFGLFWALMMTSQIFGNILTTFVLGLIGNTAYFIVLTVLGFASAFLFLLLPEVDKEYTDTLSLKNQSSKIIELMKNKDYKYLTLYYYFPGIAIGFYATYLFKLIGLSVPQDAGQSDDDYAKRLNYRIGYVFIALGVSQACFGMFMNQFGERFCKFKLAISGTILVELAGFISLLCYFLESYALCFVISFLWGGCDTFIQTNIGAIISALFPGKVEAFSVYRVFFALGAVTTIILNIALDGTAPWIFLAIVMAIQMFYSLVSIRVMQLKGRVKTSLLDKEQST